MQSRRAFSVVEIMVALLIATNVLVILWQVFTADQKRFARDGGKLAAMQAALLFAERLETDLREIALNMPDPGEPDREFTLDAPVRVEENFTKLGFMMFGAHDKDAPLVKVQRVTYSYDPQAFKIRRTVGTETGIFKTLMVQAVKFQLLPLTPRFDALALTPPPLLFKPGLPVHFLKYEVTCAPEEAGRLPKDTPDDRKVTLVNAVALLYRADRANHPYWSFNVSELPAKP